MGGENARNRSSDEQTQKEPYGGDRRSAYRALGLLPAKHHGALFRFQIKNDAKASRDSLNNTVKQN